MSFVDFMVLIHRFVWKNQSNAYAILQHIEIIDLFIKKNVRNLTKLKSIKLH